MHYSDDYYRELLFYTWFDAYVKDYKPTLKQGKRLDRIIQIKRPAFITLFNNVYKANKRHYESANDCYIDCMALVWQGLLLFQISDDSTWEAIYKEEDNKNYSKLLQYLKTYVRENMKRMNNDYIETTKRTVDEQGNKHITHVFYKVASESLQQLVLMKPIKEKAEMQTIVKRSYWQQHMDYKGSIFLEWVKENKTSLLKESDLKLLEELENANYSTFDKARNGKLPTRDIKTKLTRICDKLTKEYLKSERFLTGGFVLKSIRNEYKILIKYMDILNSGIVGEELEHQLADYVIKSMDSNCWEKIIYDYLPKEVEFKLIQEYQQATLINDEHFKLYGKRIHLPMATLNYVTEAVYKRLAELEDASKREIAYLEQLGDKEDREVKLMYFELPTNGTKIVYLNVNPDGIMFQE